MSKVLIIGGVAGGASCAARLRRLDSQVEITMFERGPYISYANCGLPYHVGPVITDRDELLLMTPELMKERFDVDARVLSEIIRIDREKKEIRVREVESGREYTEGYDTLVIATGSSPLRPPIPGIEHDRVQTLWTVPDADRIRAMIKERHIQTAAVIGGGFIGLEMAENLAEKGIQVSLIEMAPHILPPFDPEMALPLEKHMREKGVDLILGDGVKAFEPEGEGLKVVLNSGAFVKSDMAILAIGVRPNSQLAKEAGLPLGKRGGILTDLHMRTEDPSIYAVGDAVEVRDLVFDDPAMIPLAGPANRQGRTAADNIAGKDSRYEGSLGSAIIKLFDLTAASTGMNEKALTARGLIRGKDFDSVLLAQNDHAGYYPGATHLFIKLLFALPDGKVLGAQAFGEKGVDKRMDVLATAMRLNATVHDLTKLELCYAPPYSSAKDPVNMAGFMAVNVLEGLDAFAPWDESWSADSQVLDIREDYELSYQPLPGAVHIPFGQLRERMDSLDKEKPIVIFCAIGVRAHSANRLLRQAGFKQVSIYPGGMAFHDEVKPSLSK